MGHPGPCCRTHSTCGLHRGVHWLYRLQSCSACPIYAVHNTRLATLLSCPGIMGPECHMGLPARPQYINQLHESRLQSGSGPHVLVVPVKDAVSTSWCPASACLPVPRAASPASFEDRPTLHAVAAVPDRHYAILMPCAEHLGNRVKRHGPHCSRLLLTRQEFRWLDQAAAAIAAAVIAAR